MGIQGRKVAIVATHGFEQTELTEPLRALREAGATVEVISPEPGEIQGFKHFDKGEKVKVDRPLDDANAEEYDALVIPGGLFNPDQLRVNDKALGLVKAFAQSNKTIAAICHGPWLLVNAGVVKGRTVTSVPTIRVDLANAGAKTVDKEVCVDGNLITSRTPKDLQAFCRAILDKLAQRSPAEAVTA